MFRSQSSMVFAASLFLAVVGAAMLVANLGQACPFCGTDAQTFTEEMNSMDAVVLAALEVPPTTKSGDPKAVVPKGKFKIVEVLKGKALLANQPLIETTYYGDAKPGKLFMITGKGPENFEWSTPVAITERVHQYLKLLPTVPKDGAERMAFFQNYLEDSDDTLARDAYDEFAKAPYSSVKDLKSKMKHDQLVEWIQNPDLPQSRRRLYLTMLGCCGSEKDVPMLETMLTSSDRKQKAGLDALIACYLILRGPEGMTLIENQFLKNPKAEYADTYAAIMAVRFHGTEATAIPKDRLLQGLRYLLERPQLADLVIPDLARWEDWGSMDRLVELFKKSDEKTSWVKVPIVNFLRACPLPVAKEHIKELEKLDPDSVKRAFTFFPLATGSGGEPNKS